MHIVTPTSDFYSGEIEYMTYPAPDGIVGIMKGALPRIAVLSAGEINIKTSVLDLTVVCGDGIVHIDGSSVTVLCEKCAYKDSESDEDTTIDDFGGVKTAKARIATSVRKLRDKSERDI